MFNDLTTTLVRNETRCIQLSAFNRRFSSYCLPSPLKIRLLPTPLQDYSKDPSKYVLSTYLDAALKLQKFSSYKMDQDESPEILEHDNQLDPV